MTQTKEATTPPLSLKDIKNLPVSLQVEGVDNPVQIDAVFSVLGPQLFTEIIKRSGFDQTNHIAVFWRELSGILSLLQSSVDVEKKRETLGQLSEVCAEARGNVNNWCDVEELIDENNRDIVIATITFLEEYIRAHYSSEGASEEAEVATPQPKQEGEVLVQEQDVHTRRVEEIIVEITAIRIEFSQGQELKTDALLTLSQELQKILFNLDRTKTNPQFIDRILDAFGQVASLFETNQRNESKTKPAEKIKLPQSVDNLIQLIDVINEAISSGDVFDPTIPIDAKKYNLSFDTQGKSAFELIEDLLQKASLFSSLAHQRIEVDANFEDNFASLKHLDEICIAPAKKLYTELTALRATQVDDQAKSIVAALQAETTGGMKKRVQDMSLNIRTQPQSFDQYLVQIETERSALEQSLQQKLDGVDSAVVEAVRESDEVVGLSAKMSELDLYIADLRTLSELRTKFQPLLDKIQELHDFIDSTQDKTTAQIEAKRSEFEAFFAQHQDEINTAISKFTQDTKAQAIGEAAKSNATFLTSGKSASVDFLLSLLPKDNVYNKSGSETSRSNVLKRLEILLQEVKSIEAGVQWRERFKDKINAIIDPDTGAWLLVYQTNTLATNIDPLYRELDEKRDAGVITEDQYIELKSELSIADFKKTLQSQFGTVRSYVMNNSPIGTFFSQKDTTFGTYAEPRIKKILAFFKEHSPQMYEAMEIKNANFNKMLWAHILSYASFEGLKSTVIGTNQAFRDYPATNPSFYTTNEIFHHAMHENNSPHDASDLYSVERKYIEEQIAAKKLSTQQDIDSFIDKAHNDPDSEEYKELQKRKKNAQHLVSLVESLAFPEEVLENPTVLNETFRIKIGETIAPGEKTFNGAEVLGIDGEWAVLKSEVRVKHILMSMFNEMLTTTNPRFRINYTNFHESNSLETIHSIARKDALGPYIEEYVIPIQVEQSYIQEQIITRKLDTNEKINAFIKQAFENKDSDEYKELQERRERVRKLLLSVDDYQIKQAFVDYTQTALFAKFASSSADFGDNIKYKMWLDYILVDYHRGTKNAVPLRAIMFASPTNINIWRALDEQIKTLRAENKKEGVMGSFSNLALPTPVIQETIERIINEPEFGYERYGHLARGKYMTLGDESMVDQQRESLDKSLALTTDKRGIAVTKFSGRRVGALYSGIRGPVANWIIIDSDGIPRLYKDHKPLTMDNLSDANGNIRFDLFDQESVYGDMNRFYGKVGPNLVKLYNDVISVGSDKVGSGIVSTLGGANKTGLYSQPGYPQALGASFQLGAVDNPEEENRKLAETMILADAMTMAIDGKNLHDIENMLHGTGSMLDAHSKEIIGRIMTAVWAQVSLLSKLSESLVEQLTNKLKFT